MTKPEDLEDGSIDAGLYVLSQINEFGNPLSHTDISIVCGCHRGYISLVEKAALRKLRRKLMLEVNRELARDMRIDVGSLIGTEKSVK